MHKDRSSSWPVCILLAGLMCSVASAASAQFTFQKVFDQATPVPDSLAIFDILGIPSLDGQDLAFKGTGSDNVRGIYKRVGGQLSLVADTTTPIPAGSGLFVTFDTPSLDDGAVAFRAEGDVGQSGIYTDAVAGGLARIADEATTVPDLGGTYSSFEQFPSIDADNIAFSAIGDVSNERGLYLWNGNLSTVLNTEDDMPGVFGNFGHFFDPTLEAGVIAFVGARGSSEGVYRFSGGSVSLLASEDTLQPGTPDDFRDFAGFAVLGGLEVGFAGVGQTIRGIYRSSVGLEIEADTLTPIPDGTGNFSTFSFSTDIGPSLDCDVTVFIGPGLGGQKGIYARKGAILQKVVDLTDTLGGLGIQNLFISREALSGESIAFGVNRPGGSTTTVDEIWIASSDTALCAGPPIAVPMGGGQSALFLLGLLLSLAMVHAAADRIRQVDA